MLKMMRHHAKYFYVLFFIVILSFIFWGVGTVDKSDQNNILAEVGKHKITADEFWRAYDRAFKIYREIYKEKFDEEMQKNIKLKENVLSLLIDSRILLIAAKENSIKVSDDELNEAIISEPAFMKNGSFDNEVYHNKLRLLRMTVEEYETIRRQELTISKIRRFIELSASIPENELTSMSDDEQTLSRIKESMINDAKEKAVRAYINGLKKGMNIKIYNERLS